MHPLRGERAKRKSLDFSRLFRVGGRNRARTCGLAALGQVRNSRLASLPLAMLLCSPRFRVAFAFGEQPTGLTLRSAPPRCFTSRVPQVQSILGNTKEKGPPVGQSFFFGGRNRARTCDPRDVNTVLRAIGQVVKLKYGREHTSEALEIWAFLRFGLCSRRMCSGCVQLCSLALNTGVFSCVQGVFTALMCSFFAEHGHEKA